MSHSLASTCYDLFTRDGQTRFVLRQRDEGIRIGESAISVLRSGQWVDTPFASISTIRLSTALVGRRQIAQCVIELRDGSKLITSNASASGLRDSGRDSDYRSFVRSLHNQLLATGAASRIRFISGFSQARMNVLIASLIVATAFFFILPLVMLMVTQNPKALLAMLASIGLLIPSGQIVKVNQPATYAPDMPPDLVK